MRSHLKKHTAVSPKRQQRTARDRRIAARTDARRSAPSTRLFPRRQRFGDTRKNCKVRQTSLPGPAIEIGEPLVQDIGVTQISPPVSECQPPCTALGSVQEVDEDHTAPLSNAPSRQPEARLLVTHDPEKEWEVKAVHGRRLCREHDEEVMVEFCDTMIKQSSLEDDFIRTLRRLHKVSESDVPAPDSRCRDWLAECTTILAHQVYQAQESIGNEGQSRFVIRWKLMWISRKDLSCKETWLQRQLAQSEDGIRRSKRLRHGYIHRINQMQAINETLRNIE